MGALIYHEYELEMRSIEEVRDEISEKASSEINFYVEEIINDMKLAGDIIVDLEIMNLKNDQVMKNLIEHNPSIFEASLIDKNGKEMSRLGRYSSFTSSDYRDFSNDKRFFDAVDNGQYISSVYISEYNIPFVTMSVPVYDKNNKIAGAVSTEVDLSSMWETVSKIKVKDTGYVYVVDEEGGLIAYKNIKLVKNKMNLRNLEIVKDCFDNKHASKVYISFTEEEVIGKCTDIEITGWGLVIEIPTKEAYQDLIIIFYIAGLSVIVSLVSIVVSLRSSFSVSGKIEKLTKIINKISTGDLSASIDVSLKNSKDEIGELAQAFDRTIVSLKLSMKKQKQEE